MSYSLRISSELKELLMETSRHAGISMTDILHRTRRGILRKRHVIQRKLHEKYYKTGSCIVTVRDFSLPETCSPETFRKTCALRCLETLAAPSPKPLPETGKVEGKDYIIAKGKE